MENTIAFIHGLDSSSRGTKGTWFRERFPEMLFADFTGGFSEKMDQMQALLAQRPSLVLVGSSYGGLMAAVYACGNEERMTKLILLAPALHLPEFHPCLERTIRTPVVLVHGRQDDVCPPVEVHGLARRVFPSLTHVPVDDDHSLHRAFPALDWERLLRRPEAGVTGP